MADLTILSERLGGSPLSRAIRGGQLSAAWSSDVPRSPEQWRQRVLTVGSEFAGGHWLDAIAGALPADGFARDEIARVVAAGGVVVTTGQQPGLFGGPIMTFAKALSARSLAAGLEDATGTPVATIFWAATDDADFEEAAAVWVQVRGGAAELQLRAKPTAGTPMADAPLDGAEIGPLLATFREAAGSAAYTEALDAVERAYRAGRTVGSAYVALLRELLGPLGIAVLDASHPSVHRASRFVMERALERASAIERALRAQSEDIRALGFQPQVEDVKGLSLVFANSGGVKRRIRIEEAARWADDASLGTQTLSPTVLLRPVTERAILPTVAYVGGPAEVSYFAQSTVLAHTLACAAPVVVPRWSGTIVEPKTAKALARLNLGPHELSDVDAAAARLARSRMPAAVRAAIDTLNARITEGVDHLRQADEARRLPEAVLSTAAEKMAQQVAHLEERYAAASRRADAQLERDLATAAAALYPGGVRQERRHAFVPYLAKYGPGLFEDLSRATQAHARELLGITSPAPIGVGTDVT